MFTSNYLDLINDIKRNRFLSSVCILMMYVLLLFTIFITTKVENESMAQIKVQTFLKSNLILNDNIKQNTLIPRLHIKSTKNKLLSSRFRVQINLVDLTSEIITDINPETKNDWCDPETRRVRAGSLEMLRLQDVCQISLEGNIESTDKAGRISYPNFHVQQGVKGYYSFNFQILDSDQSTEPLDNVLSYFDTNVAQIEVLSPAPPLYFQVGQTLEHQPRVRVLDINENPVQNKIVVVFSSPEASLYKISGSQFAIQASKYAVLSGYFSEPSDENGIAIFKNLTVLGMSHNFIYFIFQCDGAVTVPWQQYRAPVYDNIGAPKLNQPSYCQTNHQIEITRPYSQRVLEGSPFEIPIRVRITNYNTSIPLANQMIIATLRSEDGITYPYGYRFIEKGEIKQTLIKPISGQYRADLTDIFSEQNIFTPGFTDSSGQFELKEMYFSVYGQSNQNFQIRLWCEGAFIDSENIFVETNVEQVDFVLQPNIFINEDVQDFNELRPIIKISDQSGKGVHGKRARARFLNPATNLTYAPDELQLYLNDTFVQTSDDEGMITLKLIYSYSQYEQIQIVLQVDVDGVKARSDAFEILDKIKFKDACGSVFMYENGQIVKEIGQLRPMKIHLNYSQSYDVSFLAVNELGAPMSDIYVGMFVYNVNQFIFPPLSIIPQITFENSDKSDKFYQFSVVQTDNFGIATFKKLTITRSAEGKFLIVFYAISGQNLAGSRRILESRFLQDYGTSFTVNTDETEKETHHQDSQKNMDLNNEANNSDKTQRVLSDTGDQTASDEGVFQDLFASLKQSFSIKNDLTGSIDLNGDYQQNEIQICYGAPFFEIVVHKRLHRIQLLDTKDIPPKKDQRLRGEFHLAIFDINNQPIPNYPVQVQIEPLHLPGIYLPYYWEVLHDKTQFLYTILGNIDQLNDKSNEDGIIVIQLGLLQRSVGFFSFLLSAQSVYLFPLSLRTEIEPRQIEIIEMPESDQPLGRSTRCGNFMKSGPIKLQVTDQRGDPVPDFPLMLQVDQSDRNNPEQKNKILLDGSDISFLGYEETMGVGYFRVNFTNSEGVATFDQITIVDAVDTQCLKFRFYGGDLDPTIESQDNKNFDFCFNHTRSGYCIRSPPTNSYCFNSEYNIDISNRYEFSKTLAPNQPMTTPIKIIYRKNYITDVDRNGTQFFQAILLSESNQNLIKDPLIETFIQLFFTTCYVQTNIDDNDNISFFSRCPLIQLSTIPNQIVAEITFPKIQWVAPVSKNTFQLSLSTLANFKRPPKKPFNIQNISLQNSTQIQDFFQDLITEYRNQITNSHIDELNALKLSIIETLQQIEISESSSISSITENIRELYSKFKNLIKILQDMIINILDGQKQSSETGTMKIAQFTTNIRFIKYPPLVFQIKKLIPVQIEISTEDNLNLAKVPIRAVITPASNAFQYLGPQLIQSLISGMGDGKVDFKSLGRGVNNRKNFELDPKSEVIKSDENGVAKFNLRILSGIPGFYKIKFETLGFQTDTEIYFFLRNRIINVTLIETPDVLEGREGVQMTLLKPIQLQLQYDQTLKSENEKANKKSIQIVVYQYFDYNRTENQFFESQDKLTESILEKFNNPNEDSKKLLNSVKEIIISGGNYLMATERADQNLPSQIVYSENAEGIITIEQLNITFFGFGDYMMVVSVDGIDSQISKRFTFQLQQFSNRLQIEFILITIFCILLALFLPVINRIELDQSSTIVKILLPTIVFLIALSILIIMIVDMINILPTISLVFRILNILMLFLAIIDIMRISINKLGSNLNFNRQISSLQKLYVQDLLQHLFDHQQRDPQSQGEIQRKNSKNNQHPENIQLTNMNQNPKAQREFQIQKQFLHLTINSEENLDNSNAEILLGKDQVIFQTHSLSETPQRESSLLQEIKNLFRTIDTYLENLTLLKSYYVIPSRIISGLLVSYFAVAFIIYQLILLIDNVDLQIERAMLIVENNYNTFLSSAANKLTNMNGGLIDINEEIYNQLLVYLGVVIDIFQQLRLGLRLGFSIAIPINLLLFIVNSILFLIDFGESTIKLRQGSSSEGLVEFQKQINFRLVVQFIPLYVSNTILSYLISVMLIGFSLTPVFTKIFWQILWQFRQTLFYLIFPILLNLALQYVGLFIVLDIQNNTVRFKFIHSVIVFVQLYTSMTTGIILALIRYIVLVSITSFNIMKCEKTVFSKWVYDAVEGDFLYTSYTSLVGIQRLHKNPIVTQFCNILQNTAKNSQDSPQLTDQNMSTHNQFNQLNQNPPNPKIAKQFQKIIFQKYITQQFNL